ERYGIAVVNLSPPTWIKLHNRMHGPFQSCRINRDGLSGGIAPCGGLLSQVYNSPSLGTRTLPKWRRQFAFRLRIHRGHRKTPFDSVGTIVPPMTLLKRRGT